MRPLLTTSSLLFVSVLLSVGAPAAADVVHLRDGRTLEGSVIRAGDTLIVRRKLGSSHVHLSDVLRIEETTDRWDEVERLRGQLANGTADERYRFGVWCRDHDFKEESQRAFLSVLRLDLDHAGARAALGYVLHEGRWLSRADKKRLEGLVEHEGAWVTPEEKAKRVAAKKEEARKARAARREAAEAEKLAKRQRREAERTAKREARRERSEAIARARAWQRVTSTRWTNWGGGNGGVWGGRVLYPYGFGGTCTTGYRPYGTYLQPRWGRGVNRGYSYRRYGVQLDGNYSRGNTNLRWRVGY
jgi:hypothetical protein